MSYEREFEIALLKAYGNSFQDLFYRLMNECSSDFIPVRPNGPLGDCGCDGYLSNKGKYFQVYGPENPADSNTKSYSMKKINEDFMKIFKYVNSNDSLPKIKKYVFVYNNKMDASITLENSKKYEELKKEFKERGIKFRIWNNQKLMEKFRGLSKCKQANIVNSYSNNYDNEEFLSKIINENIQYDIENIRKIKEVMKNALNGINKYDFVAPFGIEVLGYMEELETNLNDISFNNKNLKKIKDDIMLNLSNLLQLVDKYTKFVNGMGIMKRIEPWGEIRNENFEDVQNKMLEARKKAYFSIKELLKQEEVLIQQLNINK